MSKVAIYPGTFDPITYGHVDVIKKGLKIFDKIVVGVSEVHNKNYLFSTDERLERRGHGARQCSVNAANIKVVGVSVVFANHAVCARP